MSVTETQQRHLADFINDEPTVAIPSLNEASRRSSLLIPAPSTLDEDSPTLRTPKKTKDDIRYYFRPVPKEDIRIYFRPVSRLMGDRPRVSRTRTVPHVGKSKGRSRRSSPNGEPPSPPGPEVPPKAKARTSGQKNREIFLNKHQSQNQRAPGRTDQNGSAALPGFDPILANNGNIPPGSPLSPRITEVVDSSLLPSPLRKKSEAAAESAPEHDDRMDKFKQLSSQDHRPNQEYQLSIMQEYQQTTLPYKPNSIYGTLPPLPIRLQRNNSQPTLQSPKMVRHRRKDTPYSPNDVGLVSVIDSPELVGEARAVSDGVERTSAYASSDALPTPVALEMWASEQRRIANGQLATGPKGVFVAANKANSSKDKDKILKKAMSVEAKFFRSRRGKGEKKEKEKEKLDKKDKVKFHGNAKTYDSLHNQHSQPAKPPQTSRPAPENHHPGTRWDVAAVSSSPAVARPLISTRRSDMNDKPRSDSVSDKIVVDPQLTRAHSDERSTASSTATTAVKAKKPNPIARGWRAYLKNVEGLQMVQ